MSHSPDNNLKRNQLSNAKSKPSFPATMDLSLGQGAKQHISRGSVAATAGSLASQDSVVSRAAIKRTAAQAFLPQGLGLDSSAVRTRMVSKLATQGISDERVLNAMLVTPRHRFVDTALANQAYEDTSLPIGWGQTISKPNVVARMLELLCHGKEAPLGRVLEIGTGCGYQAVVLRHLSQEVYSIERLRGLFEKAQCNVRPFSLKKLHLLFGDGMLGFADGAPYAGIIAAAGGEAIPQAWIDQLAVGGRIVAPVAKAENMTNITSAGTAEQCLMVIDKTSVGIKRTILELVQFVPLKSGIG